jgi:hypothetical protein
VVFIDLQDQAPIFLAGRRQCTSEKDKIDSAIMLSSSFPSVLLSIIARHALEGEESPLPGLVREKELL